MSDDDRQYNQEKAHRDMRQLGYDPDRMSQDEIYEALTEDAEVAKRRDSNQLIAELAPFVNDVLSDKEFSRLSKSNQAGWNESHLEEMGIDADTAELLKRTFGLSTADIINGLHARPGIAKKYGLKLLADAKQNQIDQAFKQIQQHWGIDKKEMDRRMKIIHDALGRLPQQTKEKYDSPEGLGQLWQHLEDSGLDR